MKSFQTIIFLFISFFSFSQTAITAVSTINVTPTATTYADGTETYKWGVSPNNNNLNIASFTAGITYSKLAIAGSVIMRRVDNPFTIGNYTTVWAESVKTGTSPFATYNIKSSYVNDMNVTFNSSTLNTGTDNLFNNDPNSGSLNSNNIERMDYLLANGYTSTVPNKVGISVFERGATGANDAFNIAIITGVSGTTPTAYSKIKRVTSLDYGNFGPAITYRLYKGQSNARLLDDNLGFNTQTMGGVFFKLSDFGIAAGTTIYGYSIFAADFPTTGTPADVVNFNNATNFPTNTSNALGGIDLIAFLE